MKRMVVLDGLRGYFLVFMTINHLIFQDGTLLAWINHAELGYVQDAQGFVFLSGMIIGLYYTRLMTTQGTGAVTRKLLARAYELYIYAALVMGVVFVLAYVIPDSRTVWGSLIWDIYDNPALHGISAMLLLYQPSFMDILPQYILYLAVSPLLLVLVARGRWQLVLGSSILVWFLVQLGWHDPVVVAIERWVGVFLPGFEMRTQFNPLAWQLVFVTGLLIGSAEAKGKLNRDHLFPRRQPDLLLLAIALFLLFLAYRIAFHQEVLGDYLTERFWSVADRTDFGFVYVLNFAALAYIVAWLILNGRDSASRIVRALGGFLNRLFRVPFLTLLGKHSLQVYAYHVVLVYVLIAIERWHGPFGEAAKLALALGAVASLALPALLHERIRTGSVPGGSKLLPAGRRT